MRRTDVAMETTMRGARRREGSTDVYKTYKRCITTGCRVCLESSLLHELVCSVLEKCWIVG